MRTPRAALVCAADSERQSALPRLSGVPLGAFQSRGNTKSERPQNHTDRPRESLFAVLGCVIVGLVLGEMLYVALIGRPPLLDLVRFRGHVS